MKICENCSHLFQKAMARVMSNGNAGYCSLIQNDPNNNKKTKDGV